MLLKKLSIPFFALFLLSICDGYVSTYVEQDMLKHIDKNEVHYIVELGGFKFDDTLQIYQYYQCPMVTFEPNSELVKNFRYKLEGINDITIEQKAVWDETKMLDFNLCSFAGASSIYTIDYLSLGNWNRKSEKEMSTQYPMKSIPVEATRLDDWLMKRRIPQVDLLCMDVQGAALPVLKSLGKYLETIKYVITEVEYNRIYHSEALFPEILNFMEAHGFTCFNREGNESLFGDVIFVRNDLVKKQVRR